MKDSKQVRSEYQSFVESYSSIAAKGAEEAKEAEMKKKSSRKEKEDDECSCEKESVLMRKSGAFTELAEKYQMSVKQFARFVENNQGLFDVPTRQKAVLANKFSGFKETVEWDKFFGDLELVEVKHAETTANDRIPDFEKTKKAKPVKGLEVSKPMEEGLGVVTGTAKAINAVMKRRDQTPAQEKKAVRDLTKAMDVVAKPVKSFLNVGDKKNQEMMNKRRPTAAQAQRMEEFDAEVEELQEIQTKETAAGTKYKVRVKEKESGSSYIRYATREKIAQLRADPKIASVEMTDEGEAPEDRGEKKAQAKGGGLAVKMKKKKEKEAAAKPAGKVKRSVTTEALDPVGKEDADIDNDNDTDKSDEYLHKRRKAIGKAMKKRMKEGFSNWREDLKEITDVQDLKKVKGGKVNNKVIINPPMGEGFDPQRVAEGLGAELVGCQEVDEAVSTGPILPGEGGKRIYPKGQEPKPTGAKLPPLQKAGYEPEGEMVSEDPVQDYRDRRRAAENKGGARGPELSHGPDVKTAQPVKPGTPKWFPQTKPRNSNRPNSSVSSPGYDTRRIGGYDLRRLSNSFKPEGEQIDEIAPALAAGAALGIGLGGMALINKLRQQKKAGEQGKPQSGVVGNLQKQNQMLQQLKQEGWVEGEVIDEKKLTEPEMKKREEVVKSMKKKGDFSKYGSRAKEVMYATATKIAKKKA